VLDLYFIENRSKVLDLAAFMDRFDRIKPSRDLSSDPRWIGIVRSLGVLLDGHGERARRILELWSDPTSEPIDRAGGKGALGVWPGIASAD